MSKHTPGPWTASMGTEDDNERWCVLNEAGYLLATVENGAPGDTLETEEANARLIAAAPGLLAACKAVVDRSGGRLYNTDQVTGSIFADLLSAAIARAEGGAA